MNKLLLIDGNNVMFRAYYATAAVGNLMMNKKGFPTNMLYGFLNIYNRFIKDYSHVAVCFDKGSKTRRHLIYQDYKAGRAETPKELIEQIPYLHKILDAMNVKYFMDYDYEADDIIASLSKSFSDSFDEVDILSNDNDLFQLIDDKHFQLYSKQKETIKYSKDVLMEEKGISPIQIPDYKALIGDKSDNLKGVEGIGPVGASKLLKAYNTLDGIYANIDKLTAKEQEKLTKSKEDAYFTLDLAKLNPTFDSGLNVDDFQIKEYNFDLLKEIYIELEFNSFLSKMAPTPKIEASFKYRIITNNFDNIISKDSINYLYLETLGENYHFSTPIGFSLTNIYGTFFIPFEEAITSLEFPMFLENNDIKKVVYDYKMMYVVLKKYNISLCGIYNDLLLSSYLIDPDLGKCSLKELSSHFGYIDLSNDTDIYSKKLNQLPFIDIYSEHIARKSFVLSLFNNKELEEIKQNDQEYLLNQIEIPFSKVLGDMELLGLRVDNKELDRYEDEIVSELKQIENEIYEIVGHEFNILSPKQLSDVLFNELGLVSSKKNKTGYSTDQTVLESLKGLHPVIDKILRYRMLSKLENTYVIGVRNALSESNDNHIHTIYKQALTDTGRLSSTEPNLQNLPIRNKESREFRKIFIPENNCYLISSDYSQIELRVMAHMSNDNNLINAFRSGADIHAETAKAILKKNEVTKEERSKAKAINFGIIYGISAWGLSNDIQISPYEAQEFIAKYHEAFPKIAPFSNSLIEFAKENGYVKTIFNRRRYIRDINSSVYTIREFNKRTAMNAPIQGSAADILKKAMVDLDSAIKSNMLHSRMVLTIHDEIVLNTPKEELDKTLILVKDIMENVLSLNVPLLIESSYGETLFEAK